MATTPTISRPWPERWIQSLKNHIENCWVAALIEALVSLPRCQGTEGNTKAVSDEQRELAIAQYQAGQLAFERGEYKAAVSCFEQGANLAPANSSLGGDIRLWLVNAYAAANRDEEAISLCETLARYPDLDIRKQGKQLLYILKAPRLQLRPEWQTKIPDLSRLDQGDGPSTLRQYTPPTPTSAQAKKPVPEPEDLSTMNLQDNGFLWVALVGGGLMLGGLLWWG